MLETARQLEMIGDIISAVTSTIDQVLATFLFGIILVWIFCVIGFSGWGWAAYEYGDGGGGWETALASFLQHVDFGFRGAPVFDSDYEAPAHIGQFIFDVRR